MAQLEVRAWTGPGMNGRKVGKYRIVLVAMTVGLEGCPPVEWNWMNGRWVHPGPDFVFNITINEGDLADTLRAVSEKLGMHAKRLR